MVTHASTDSDISNVYFSLIIHDQKKIIKATIGEIVTSQLKEGCVIENIVVGQVIIEEDTVVVCKS